MSIAATSANFPSHRPAVRARGAESARLARQKLTQGQRTKPEFDYELLQMFASNELGATLTIPLLAVIIALASMYWANPHEPFIWLAVLLAARTILTRLCSRFLAEPRASCDVKVWRHRLI